MFTTIEACIVTAFFYLGGKAGDPWRYANRLDHYTISRNCEYISTIQARFGNLLEVENSCIQGIRFIKYP